MDGWCLPRRVKKMVGCPKTRSLTVSKMSCRKLSGILGSRFLTTSSGPGGFPLVTRGGGRRLLFLFRPPLNSPTEPRKGSPNSTTGSSPYPYPLWWS